MGDPFSECSAGVFLYRRFRQLLNCWIYDQPKNDKDFSGSALRPWFSSFSHGILADRSLEDPETQNGDMASFSRGNFYSEQERNSAVGVWQDETRIMG